MEPTVIIAGLSLVSTIAIAIVARGTQRGDKTEDRVTILESEVATLKANLGNVKELLEGLKKDVHTVNEKLDRLVK